MKEYIVYADDQEVLVQVVGDKIVSTGPLLRNFCGHNIKYFHRKCQANGWARMPIFKPIARLRLTEPLPDFPRLSDDSSR